MVLPSDTEPDLKADFYKALKQGKLSQTNLNLNLTITVLLLYDLFKLPDFTCLFPYLPREESLSCKTVPYSKMKDIGK